MKRIEISLNVGVVAPLLDFIKPVVKSLECETAFATGLVEVDHEFDGLWREGLIQTQIEDCRCFLGLFGAEFCDSGRIELTEENADRVLRATAAVRLKLRSTILKDVSDEALEGSEVDFAEFAEPKRLGFSAYLFLATLQEIVIKHLVAP